MVDYQLLAEAISKKGLAPYGIRYSEELTAPTTAKGKGYFGAVLDEQERPMTELSSAYMQDGKLVSHPLLVPSLTKKEIDLLKMGGEPTAEIYQKAQDWAQKRIGAGQSPFATPQDIRFPAPQ